MTLQVHELQKMISARLPTLGSEFRLSIWQGPDGKDHIALVRGDVEQRENVLTRVHSECFTGDVLGSKRCDCGPQLNEALRLISEAPRGVILYLRQEGRGIGLLEKMKAYNLQDEGFDTVDANLALGHEADARDYSIAAKMLDDLKIRSITLLTNNPLKVTSLKEHGIDVAERAPLNIQATPESAHYMKTKVDRMNHLIAPGMLISGLDPVDKWLSSHPVPADRPLVTVAFAQSLDGSIAAKRGCPLVLSGADSMLMTHKVRRAHDGILVGIDTVLADDPQLTVRLVEGPSPRPIVADSKARFPLSARLLQGSHKALIGVAPGHDAARKAELESAGVEVMEIPATSEGWLDLPIFFRKLRAIGVERLMVEGGARILDSVLRHRLADRAIITVAPKWVGGLRSIDRDADLSPLPDLKNSQWQSFGQDMAILADLCWPG